jgi:protein-S-isoprenylcysteine O-methyltransferase Ste14
MNKTSKIPTFIGVAFWVALYLFRLAQVLCGVYFAGVLALQSGLVAYCVYAQRETIVSAPRTQQLAAWSSSVLGLLMLPGRHPSWILLACSIPGVALSSWAVLALGRSFGIAPADRGLVQGGPYRLVRHPMYLGEILALLPVLIGCFTPLNVAIFLLIGIAQVARITWEERMIYGYEAYEQNVPWRLVPGIW